jgi:hypothetical protein
VCLICNMIKFSLWGVVRTSPNPQAGGPPLVAVRDCVFYMSSAILHIWRPFLHPQPEDLPCRGDRDPLIIVTGTQLSLWQGPSYHCDGDPLTVKRTHLSLWQGPNYHCDGDPVITVTGPIYYCDRDPVITVTGTHLSRWQGPVYHGGFHKVSENKAGSWNFGSSSNIMGRAVKKVMKMGPRKRSWTIWFLLHGIMD